MSTYIRAGDLRIDDVIVVAGEDFKVIDTAYYKKQGRKWINLVLEQGPTDGSTMDRAFPVEVILPWRGTALF